MADKIKIVCECGKALKAPASYAGKDVKCPHCGRVQTLPAASSSTQEMPPPANDPLDALAPLAPPPNRLPVRPGEFMCPSPKCDFVGRMAEYEVTEGGTGIFVALALIFPLAVAILIPMMILTTNMEKHRADTIAKMEKALEKANVPVNYEQARGPSPMTGYNLIAWSILVVGAAICLMLSGRNKRTEYRCPWCGMRL